MSSRWGLHRSPRLMALLCLVVLSSCALLPGEADVTPTVGATPPTAATPVVHDPPSLPAPTPALPSIKDPTFPTPVPPDPQPSTSATTKPPAQGLQTRLRTLRGRSGSAFWTITIPVFSGKPVAAEINTRVRAAVNDLIRQVRREAKQDGGTKRTLTGDGTVVTNDGRTAQVTIIFTDYLAGTAHPANYVTTTVVAVKTGRPVLLGEVIQNPPEALRVLRTAITKAARKQGDSVDKTGLAPKLANWATWQTTTTGIRFHFGDYQLGGRGLRTYDVPWRVAQPMLSEYGETLLGPP